MVKQETLQQSNPAEGGNDDGGENRGLLEEIKLKFLCQHFTSLGQKETLRQCKKILVILNSKNA